MSIALLIGGYWRVRAQVFTNVDAGVLWTLFFIYTWFVHLDGSAGHCAKAGYDTACVGCAAVKENPSFDHHHNIAKSS